MEALLSYWPLYIYVSVNTVLFTVFFHEFSPWDMTCLRIHDLCCRMLAHPMSENGLEVSHDACEF
jgi:hypothetical protein